MVQELEMSAGGCVGEVVVFEGVDDLSRRIRAAVRATGVTGSRRQHLEDVVWEELKRFVMQSRAPRRLAGWLRVVARRALAKLCKAEKSARRRGVPLTHSLTHSLAGVLARGA